MKKIFSLILLIAGISSMFAQNNPNRMIVTDTQGGIKGYVLNNVDSVSFATVPNNIKADVTFNKFATGATGDTIWVSIKKSEGCKAFKISVMPKTIGDRIDNDLSAVKYVEGQGEQFYTEDFTNAQMTGIELNDGSDYTILTVGYDEYGIGSNMSKTNFSTPKKGAVGNPNVEMSVVNVTTDSFTVKFTPNTDVSEYAVFAEVSGQLQQQYEMFGPMFGFSSIVEMIYSWGVKYSVEESYTWKKMTPDTEYEVFVVPVDKAGTKCDYIVSKLRTSVLGGEGVAEVTISLGEFGGDAMNGFYQYVVYTPNDQAAVHRDMIVTKEAFDREWNEAKIKEYLMADNPQDPYWDWYGVDNAQWNVDPNTAYIAFSYAKNAKGEWGPLARLEFTTPSANKSAVSVSNKNIIANPVRLNVEKKQSVTPEVLNLIMKLSNSNKITLK